MSLGREQPPSKTTNARTRYSSVKSDIEKQQHSSRTTICQTLRGVTMKKVWWGRNKNTKFEIFANLEINVFPLVFSFKLCICQDPRIARAYTAQTKNCALLACLAQPTYPIPARCGTDTAGRGAFQPRPEDGARTKLFDREVQFRESHTEAETGKNS